MIRIAVLADIHSNHIALDTCIAEAIRKGAEQFVFLGDYLGEFAYPEKTLEILSTLRYMYPCTFIRGNKEQYWIDHKQGRHIDWIWESGHSATGMLKYVYDRISENQIEEYNRMPISRTIKYPGYPPFIICHGTPWKVDESFGDDLNYSDDRIKNLEAQLIICAHTHIQKKRTFKEKQ